MTAPATANEVVLHLAQLGRELETLTRQLVAADKDYTQKKGAFDLAEARAYVQAVGTIGDRERAALIASRVEKEELDLASSWLRGLKAQLNTVNTRIDIGRTYGATVRAELKTLSYSESP